MPKQLSLWILAIGFLAHAQLPATNAPPPRREGKHSAARAESVVKSAPIAGSQRSTTDSVELTILDSILLGLDSGGIKREAERKARWEKMLRSGDLPNYGCCGRGLGMKPVPQIRQYDHPRCTLIFPDRHDNIRISGDTLLRPSGPILQVLRQMVGPFNYSCDKALKNNEPAVGDLSLAFTIMPSGALTSIRIDSSTTGNDRMDEEILEKAHRMAFDSIETGNVYIRYTLKFRAKAASPKKHHKPTRPPM